MYLVLNHVFVTADKNESLPVCLLVGILISWISAWLKLKYTLSRLDAGTELALIHIVLLLEELQK